MGHWRHIINNIGFPTEKYLAENGIWYQFPSTELRYFTFLFEDGDMFLKKQLEVCKISEKDKNLDYLKMVIDNTHWYNIEMFKHYNEFFTLTNKQWLSNIIRMMDITFSLFVLVLVL